MIITPKDKETPTKLRIDDEGWLCCPRCDDTFYLHSHYNNRNRYCGRCGQALDWSNVHPPLKHEREAPTNDETENP